MSPVSDGGFAVPEASSGPIRAILFDFGDVLLEWDPDRLLAEFASNDADLARLQALILESGWHLQLDRGTPFAQAATDLIARAPADRNAILAWGTRFSETIVGPVPGMQALIDQLAALGLPLFGLSNFCPEFFPSVRSRWPDLFAPLRDFILSGDVRCLKPDPAIYRLARERFALRPDQTLFIDDRPDNVAAAQAEGFAGHVFTDAPTLKHTLIAMGIPL